MMHISHDTSCTRFNFGAVLSCKHKLAQKKAVGYVPVTMQAKPT